MNDNLIKRLRSLGSMSMHNVAREAADAPEVQANRIAELEGFLSRGQLDLIDSEQAWMRRAEKAEAELAAARAELREAADKFHVFYCNARSGHPDKPFMKMLADRMSAAARGEQPFDVPVETRLGQPTGSGHGAAKSDVCPECADGVFIPPCWNCGGTGKKETK